MLDSSKYRDKKIKEINSKITKQPIYNELFAFLEVSIEEDFMQAELVFEQVEIGDYYVKIAEPSVILLDFFKERGYTIHTFPPAVESENYKNPITAWLVKK